MNDATLPRAVILRDSFFEALIPFVCEHFRRSLILPSHELDPGLIERERPDIVIEELLERYLMLGAPANPRAVDRLSPAASSPEALPVGIDEPQPGGVSLGPLSAWQATDLDQLAEGEWSSNGPVPAVEVAVAPFDAEPHQRLRIRLIARPGSEEQRGLRQARLWWSTGAGFSEPLSLPFPILVDARRHVYRVTPALSSGWRGRIERLRIQFVPLEPGVRYELGAVERLR